MELKVGDKLLQINKGGDLGFVGKVITVREVCDSGGIESNGSGFFSEDFLKEHFKLLKNGKIPKVNFLLQYELEEDPVEEFETMVQVRKRIKELLERDDLKEDSMKVYEIKSVKEVKISKSITIK